MKYIGLTATVVFMISSLALRAQIDDSKLIRMRDSLDYLLMVSPSASAILIKKSEIEFYSFSSLLSADQYNDKAGNRTSIEGKQLLFNSLFQINYGISKDRRINVGLDASYRAYTYDPTGNASTGDLFKGGPTTARGITYLGPRVRVQPFKRKQNFIYQAYVWLPVANSSTQAELAANKIDFGNTFFYYRYFGGKVGLFTQANFLFRFPKADEENPQTDLVIPLSASVSYVLGKKNIIYGSLSYSWISTNASKFFKGADSDMVQGGIGYQRIVTKRFFVNLNYTGTLAARNYGLWNSFNLGVRYLY